MDGADVLRTVKRPQRAHCYEYADSSADDHGGWLYLPRGAGWTTPHDCGVLPFGVVAQRRLAEAGQFQVIDGSSNELDRDGG